MWYHIHKKGCGYMKHELTAKRLSMALSDSNMIAQELADKSGVGKASISQYINGSHAPSNISSGKMASVLGVNPLWLMGFDVPMHDSESITNFSLKGIKINVLGEVTAGIPMDAIQNIVDTEEISEELAITGEFFALKIKGDSMEPKISKGDIVIVRKQDDAESGDVVIVLINGDDATCKRLRKYRDGIELVSTNPGYPPMFFSDDEIISKPVRIIGKVVELRAKF